jgi:type IV secretion system protein VirB10
MIEEKPTTTEEAKPQDTGPAKVSTTTGDYERQRSQTRLFTLMAFSAIVVIGGVGYWMFGRSSGPASQQQVQLPPSESTFTPTQARPPQAEGTPGRLVFDPITVDFGNQRVGGARRVVSVTLTAQGGAVTINRITLPFAQESNIDMRSDGCIKQFNPGDRCAIVLTFAPQAPIQLSNNIIINATGFDSGGATQGRSRDIQTIIEITGDAVLPPPAPPAPVVVNREQEEINASREAFLRNRQQVGGLSAQGQGNGYRAPRQTDRNWQAAGFQPTMSTLPVDMSRILTMDKPIPAVIKTTIDTRHASRAVATVERDIYGGDGRVIVIERGSTLVGTVASLGEASEEKVAIAWQRVVRPDGVAFGLRATSGNASGQSGVNALIDNRFFDRFGRTFLASLFTGGVTIALGGTSSQTQTSGASGTQTTTNSDARAIASQQIRQDMLPVFEQYRREQLALPPLRTIPAGTRITVWPSTDLMLTHPGQEQAPVAQGQNGLSGQAAQQQLQRQRQQSQQMTNQIYGAPGAPPAAQYSPVPVAPTAPVGVIPQGDGMAAPIGDYGVAAPAPVQDTSLPSETASQRLQQQQRAADQLRTQQPVYQPYAAPIQNPAGSVTITPPWATGR